MALGAAPDILMLGCPYAHAEYIGALLADALGYGYLDVRYSAPMPLDLAPDDPAVTAARIAFIGALTADDAATRKHVRSVTDHRVLPAVTASLAGGIACARTPTSAAATGLLPGWRAPERPARGLSAEGHAGRPGGDCQHTNEPSSSGSDVLLDNVGRRADRIDGNVRRIRGDGP